MWPFEGRQQELALLRSAFAAGDVDTVLVSAAAGVGKTRLAREAITGLGAQRTAWATATRAAATIPFAAVAPLLPDAAASGGSVEVIRATARRLAGWGGRREVAVVVDDAHLLDDASAALIAHLVRERLAFVVVNVRVGEPVADALLRLVRDGRGEQLRLDPLRYADIGPADRPRRRGYGRAGQAPAAPHRGRQSVGVARVAARRRAGRADRTRSVQIGQSGAGRTLRRRADRLRGAAARTGTAWSSSSGPAAAAWRGWTIRCTARCSVRG